MRRVGRVCRVESAPCLLSQFYFTLCSAHTVLPLCSDSRNLCS